MVVQGRSRVAIGEGEMGHVDVTIEVGSPDRSRFVEVPANVDTGATFTVLPRSVLEDLGISRSHSAQFQLADGSPVTRDVGEVPVRIDGKVLTTTCVFGDEGQPALVGVVTLEQFLLGVDTVNGRLIPIPGLLMAKHGKNYRNAVE
ncbi:MAG TPA: aspartyl protease family protein, partial [Dehalococcoidia bacterium]|nr:aspartyl protease family protein [Dehalococcoidia bacterium]